MSLCRCFEYFCGCFVSLCCCIAYFCGCLFYAQFCICVCLCCCSPSLCNHFVSVCLDADSTLMIFIVSIDLLIICITGHFCAINRLSVWKCLTGLCLPVASYFGLRKRSACDVSRRRQVWLSHRHDSAREVWWRRGESRRQIQRRKRWPTRWVESRWSCKGKGKGSTRKRRVPLVGPIQSWSLAPVYI